MTKKILTKLAKSVLFIILLLSLGFFYEVGAFLFLVFLATISTIFYFILKFLFKRIRVVLQREDVDGEYYFHKIIGYLFSTVFLFTNIFLLYQSIVNEPIGFGYMVPWILFQLGTVLLLVYPLAIYKINHPLIRLGNELLKNSLIFLAAFYSIPGSFIILYAIYTEHADTNPELMGMVMTELEEGRLLFTFFIGIPLSIIFAIFFSAYFRVKKVNSRYKIPTIVAVSANIVIILVSLYLS